MKGLKGFEFKNQTDESVDLYFYGDIVSDWWGAWQDEDQYPENIKNFLAEHSERNVNIYINSGGGSVFAGIAIYNMIKRHAKNHNVTVHVDGLAGSIASIFAFAGSSKPVIPANAFLMIHNPWTWAEGNAKDLRKIADDLDQIATGILNIYEENLKDGVSIETIKELMDEETWLNGEQAAEYFDVEVSDKENYMAAAGEYLNKAKNMPKALKDKKAADKMPLCYHGEVYGEEETQKTKDELNRIILSGLAKGV